MQTEHTIIIGAGPCGLSTAIELKKQGISPLIIEKGNVVNSIYNYPTHQTFFSSSDKLEIGNIPFITEKQKPVRNQALSYYRTVAERTQTRINSYEKVYSVVQQDNGFIIHTRRNNNIEFDYFTENLVVATGYYDQPNPLGVEGESLTKVNHYFKEAHPYFNKDVVVIGGKNSAVDAALELHKAGAHITVLYRGNEYSKSIKPWILPEFDSLVRKGIIQMEFNANITKIEEDSVTYEINGQSNNITNDFVFAMIGYQPDQDFLTSIGIAVDETSGRPIFNQTTMESTIPGIYIAGVIAAGYNNNEIFIENGRFHGELIANSIASRI